MIDFSVLDQSPVRAGGTPAQAIDETIQLAQATETLGYSRYWLAEHHGTDGFAGSSPEIMVTRVAAATDHIRVGSGGVMLSHYSPLKVAENFALLENMFPGRIDLGIGRAPGSDGLTASALAYGNQIGIEYFPTKIADMTAFLAGKSPVSEPFKNVRVTPVAPELPEVWLLGSSEQSAAYAAHFGLPYSFAHFITPYGSEAVVDHYRDNFRPSPVLNEPKVNLGVFVICAETTEEAEYLAASRDYWRLKLGQGQHLPYPPPDVALSYDYNDNERAAIEQSKINRFVGDPAAIKAQLEELADRHGADELVVLTITYDFAARKRSYELIAEAFGLQDRQAAA
ncbi:MAG: MsnO8 family LLM class oxidoreductase [Alphaproteobacteria bacterium]|nr:MsnO8 family LLM class oxidoreductase [Alphaproteobacteria bacterium]